LTPASPALLPPPCPAGDSLRSQLSSRTSELDSERSQVRQLSEASEQLRLSLGGAQQQLASAARELEQERSAGSDMRSRLSRLNLLSAGGWLDGRLAASAAAACHLAPCCAPGACSMRSLTRPAPRARPPPAGSSRTEPAPASRASTAASTAPSVSVSAPSPSGSGPAGPALVSKLADSQQQLNKSVAKMQ
jgi:hypothetical protein